MRETNISQMKKSKDNEIDLAEHQKTLLNLWKTSKGTKQVYNKFLSKFLAAKPL